MDTAAKVANGSKTTAGKSASSNSDSNTDALSSIQRGDAVEVLVKEESNQLHANFWFVSVLQCIDQDQAIVLTVRVIPTPTHNHRSQHVGSPSLTHQRLL